MLAGLLVVACGPSADDAAESPERQSSRVELVDMPARALQRCRTTAYVADACPERVPVMSDQFFVDSSGSGVSGYGTFSLEAGTPASEAIDAANRPPQYVRITIEAGDLDDAFGFSWPTEGRPKALDGLPLDKQRRATATFIDRASWNDHPGSLALAPSHELGGFHGNHLAFRWTDDGTEYVVSMHAWRPLGEAKATLEAIVESIP
jgi:hypothetical protein